MLCVMAENKGHTLGSLALGRFVNRAASELPPEMYESALNNSCTCACICGMQVYVTTSDVSGGAFDGSVFIVLQVRVAACIPGLQCKASARS